MAKKIEFFDGSSIEWKDKETLLYRNGLYELSISIDYYEINFFTAGRLVYSNSIKNWSVKPINAPSEIASNEKKEIIEKIKFYYKKLNTKVSIV